jgi:nitrogenase molybdenum-cofactor synthesis protein NifE
MHSVAMSMPKPSDYFGVIWALSSVDGVVMLEHGSPGTTFNAQASYGSIAHATLAGRLFTTGLTESDIVNGNESPIIDAAVELDARYAPRTIALVATGVGPVIGIDLAGVAATVSEQVEADVLCFDGGGFRGDFETGIAEVYVELVRRYAVLAERQDPKRVSIIGPSIATFNHRSDVAELERLLGLLGLEVHTVLSSRTSVQDLMDIPSSSLNIVTSQAAIAAASFLEEEFGIPFIYGLPYGLEGTKAWMADVAEALRVPDPMVHVDSEVDECRSMLRDIQRVARRLPDLRAVVSGSYETVLGLTSFFVRELGMEVPLVHLHTEPAAEAYETALREAGAGDVQIDLSPQHLASAMAARSVTLVAGNSTELSVRPEGSIGVHVGFPSVDRIAVHTMTPLLGFRGSVYIAQGIGNEIRKR